TEEGTGKQCCSCSLSLLVSGTNLAAVVLRDQHRGGTRIVTRCTTRPVTGEVACREITGASRSAGMLHVDEHRALVWCSYHASNLTALRTCQKSSDIAGVRVGGQHHVIADTSIVWVIQRAIRRVGLYPQPAVRICP